MVVDIIEYRQRIVSFYNAVKNVVSSMQSYACNNDNNVFQVLNELKMLMGRIVSFIEDSDTINALRNNIYDVDSSYPLSYLSNMLLQGLIDMEPFLQEKTIDFQCREFGETIVPSRFMSGDIHLLIGKLKKRIY